MPLPPRTAPGPTIPRSARHPADIRGQRVHRQRSPGHQVLPNPATDQRGGVHHLRPRQQHPAPRQRLQRERDPDLLYSDGGRRRRESLRARDGLRRMGDRRIERTPDAGRLGYIPRERGNARLPGQYQRPSQAAPRAGRRPSLETLAGRLRPGTEGHARGFPGRGRRRCRTAAGMEIGLRRLEHGGRLDLFRSGLGEECRWPDRLPNRVSRRNDRL